MPMLERVEVSIPKEMEHRHAADIFAAYLLGDRAFENDVITGNERNERRFGPFWQEIGQKWQLDTTNDFWLHVEEQPVVKLVEEGDDGKPIKAFLTCRYPAQQTMLELMRLMFMMRFDPDSQEVRHLRDKRLQREGMFGIEKVAEASHS